MAIIINDLNTLTDVEVTTESGGDYAGDIRSLVLFTREENVNPFIIRNAAELLAKGITEDKKCYKQAQSLFSQARTPVKAVFYGNKTATSFTEVINTYKNHVDTQEVYIWALMGDLKNDKTFADSVIAYAKTDKNIQVLLGIGTQDLTSVEVLTKFITDSKATNVAVFAEGGTNTAAGNYLFAATAGGVVGSKSLGSYIVHSSQIVNFKRETFTLEEQTKLFTAGANYLSNPAGGLFHLVNGINTDKSTYIELKLIEIWLRENLKRDLIEAMVKLDKIDVEDAEKNMIKAIVIARIETGRAAGMFRSVNRNCFAEYVDKNGQRRKLGILIISPLSEDDMRAGRLDVDLEVTYNNGWRSIKLKGKINGNGKVIFD